MQAATEAMAASVSSIDPAGIATLAPAITIASTIIGMPAKCVAMLRRSRWYAAYCVRFSSSVFTRSAELLFRFLGDRELAERRRARPRRRGRLLRALGHRRHDSRVAEEEAEVGGGIGVGERLVGGDLALAHEPEEILL